MRAWKWLGVAAVLLVLAYAVVRYTNRPDDQGKPLVVALDSEVERLDPLTIKSPKTFIVAWQVYEGLLGLDKDGNIIPKLARSWATTDSRTWHFELRNGVRFHDSPLFGANGKGRAVTADDVVASLTAFCSAAAYPAFLLTDILEGCADYNTGKATTVSGITKLGTSSVELRLIKSEPFFLRRLTTAWIAIFPREALTEANKDKWGFDLAVGTGPFQMDRNSPGEVRLIRNPDYWDPTAKGSVNNISFRVIKNDQTRLDAVRSGSVDLMLLPPSLFPAAMDPSGKLKTQLAEGVQVIRYATYNSHMIGFNATVLPDVHLRRAISLGINRDALISTLFYGKAVATGGTVPPAMKSFVSRIPPNSLYEPAAARAELAQSSYKGEPIELLVHDQASSEQIGQLVQGQLKALGIQIKLNKVDFNTAIGRMVKGDAPMFSMFLDYVFSSPELILINMFSSEKRPVPNFWQYSNPAIDARLAGLAALPPDESLKSAASIEADVVRDAPAAFLFQLDPILLQRKGLPPVQVNAHGHFDFARLGS